MKYVVKVGFREYEFDDANKATEFMESVVTHGTDPWLESITTLTVRKGNEDDKCE